jgi:hypothetical protein
VGGLHTGDSLDWDSEDFLSVSSSPSELLVVAKVANPQDLLRMEALGVESFGESGR